MKILTIQSENLQINDREYANGSCNYKHALPIYHRLFDDYNKKYQTNYTAFFWGFSKLLTNNLDEAVKRASEMIGLFELEKVTENVLILEVPDEICLETDFYNFTDEIYAYEHPDELQSIWNSIYDKRDSERQIIFPYIDKSMILEVYKLKDFSKRLKQNK